MCDVYTCQVGHREFFPHARALRSIAAFDTDAYKVPHKAVAEVSEIGNL